METDNIPEQDSTNSFMENFEKLTQNLEEQLTFISQETTSLIKQAEISVPICVKALDALKKLVHKQGFKSERDEIFFFRHLKPKISSKLIYHVQLFNIETRRPSGTKKQQKKYFTRQLRNLNRFTENNLDFYQYYRSDSTFLDEKYFIRGKADLHLILDNSFFNFDTSFNTSHDHLVAQILAYDMISLYVRNEINTLEKQSNESEERTGPVPKLPWTDSKTHLIELIYALHSLGVFSNGRADLKEIAKVFEKTCSIDLGDYYRTYLEIRNRKSGRTKFLSMLQEAFTKRMDEQDEK